MRNAGRRPVTGPKQLAATTGLAAGPAPIQLQAMSRMPERSPGGLTKERRLVERKRRAAIARRILGN